MTTTESVITNPNQNQIVSGPRTCPTTNATTTKNSIWRCSAFHGVLYFGWTYANCFGSAPERPIANQMRDEMFEQAIETASVEFASARSTRIQAPCQKRWASTNGGSSVDFESPARSSTPHPFNRPQKQTMNRTPRIAIEP